MEEGIILFKNDKEMNYKVEYINDVFVKLVDRLLIDKSNYLDGKPSIEEISHIRFLTIHRENQNS